MELEEQYRILRKCAVSTDLQIYQGILDEAWRPDG